MRLTSLEAIALVERFARFVQQHVDQDVLMYESPDRFSLEYLGTKPRQAGPPPPAPQPLEPYSGMRTY